MSAVDPLASASPLSGYDTLSADDQKKLHADPEFQRLTVRKQQYDTDIDRTIGQRRQLVQQELDQPDQTTPPPSPGPAPQFHEYAAQQMPLILSLMALGGKAFKTPGLGMLGAMNGMLEGAQQGSLDAFDRAHKQYEDHAAQLQQEWKNQQTIVESLRKARAGKINALGSSLEDMMEARKESAKDIQNLIKSYNSTEQMVKKLQIEREKLANQRQRVELRVQEDALKAYKEWNKLTANQPRMADAKATFSRVDSIVDKALSEQNGAYVSQPLQQYLKATGNHQAVQQFQADMAAIKPLMMSLELGQGNRNTDLLRKSVADTLPNVMNMSPTEVKELLRQAHQLLDFSQQYVNQAKQPLEMMMQQAGMPAPSLNFQPSAGSALSAPSAGESSGGWGKASVVN